MGICKPQNINCYTDIKLVILFIYFFKYVAYREFSGNFCVSNLNFNGIKIEGEDLYIDIDRDIYICLYLYNPSYIPHNP